MGYWFKGVTFFISRPRLWLYVAVPILINLIITVLFFSLFWDFVSDFIPSVSYPDTDLTWQTLGFYGHHLKASFFWLWHGLLWILTTLVFLGCWVISFVVLAGVIGSPFYDKLAYRIEKEKGLAVPDAAFSVKRDIFLPALYAAKMGAFEIGCACILFPVNWVPLVGPIIYFCGFCMVLSVALMAYPCERRFLSFRSQLNLAWRRRMDYLGFGIAGFLSMMPFGLAVVTLPLSACGAALLFADRLFENIPTPGE